MATRTLIATVLMLAAVTIANGQQFSKPPINLSVTQPGTITSAYYPSAYVHGPPENHFITAPLGKVIQFTVETMNIRPPSNGICSDRLTIYEGEYPKAILCGGTRINPIKYTTSVSFGSIRFETVFANFEGYQGFTIKFEFIDPVNLWYDGDSPCGRSKYEVRNAEPAKIGKIINGYSARTGEYPWQVMIQDSWDVRGTCGGSIINENWILTAGHCVYGRLQTGRWIVYAGSDTKFGGARLATGVVYLHPMYATNVRATPNLDFALIKLRVPLTFTDNIRPVCPPLPGQLFTNEQAIVSGWGKTELGVTSNELKAVTLTVSNNFDCQRTWAGVDTITNAMICTHDNAHNLDRDACGGDSGGPMTVKGSDDVSRLAGVVSWGSDPCANGKDGVYGRVTVAMDWIQSTLDNF